MVSERTVERLSLYRRFLKQLKDDKQLSVYSHQLADLSGGTPAQVRRDLMLIGCSGSPQKGYEVNSLLAGIDEFLNVKKMVNVVLIGVGNIGRALLSYFRSGKSHINIIASFDVDEHKTDRVINNCRCYHISKLSELVKKHDVKVAIITSPSGEAQNLTNIVVDSGIKGILNFAPIRLKVPNSVYVEDVDITMNIEKVLYFADDKKN